MIYYQNKCIESYSTQYDSIIFKKILFHLRLHHVKQHQLLCQQKLDHKTRKNLRKHKNFIRTNFWQFQSSSCIIPSIYQFCEEHGYKFCHYLKYFLNTTLLYYVYLSIHIHINIIINILYTNFFSYFILRQMFLPKSCALQQFPLEGHLPFHFLIIKTYQFLQHFFHLQLEHLLQP